MKETAWARATTPPARSTRRGPRPELNAAASLHPAISGRDQALLRIDDPQVLDDLEVAVSRLGDVHVHPNVVLAGHHLGRTVGSVGDRCVIERLYDIVLVECPCLGDGGRPQLEPSVHPRARAAGR